MRLSNMEESGRPHFIRVEAADRSSIDIQLSNSNIVILETKFILALPGFGALAEDDRILYPKTEGETICWRDGPHPLTVEEILALVGQSDCVREQSQQNLKQQGGTSQ